MRRGLTVIVLLACAAFAMSAVGGNLVPRAAAQVLPECFDGIDNDADGLIDDQDPGCSDSDPLTEADDDPPDDEAPIVSINAPSPVEATGPDGAPVEFTATALDFSGNPLVPTCDPASGSLFPLGLTVITCTATDAEDNQGIAVAGVLVVDSTAPSLSDPGDLEMTETEPCGVPDSHPAMGAYLDGPIASDAVDLNPSVTNDAPSCLPIGATTVTWTAVDASGNSASVSALVTIRAVSPPGGGPPPGSSPPPATPPAVGNARAVGDDHRITITYELGTGVSHVTIDRSIDDGPLATVYQGSEESFIDRNLPNGRPILYTIISWNSAGERSPGVVVVATPQLRRLQNPTAGSSIQGLPDFRWIPSSSASYYNIQLFYTPSRATQAGSSTARVKVLSDWPTAARYLLPERWTFDAKRYKLRPGVYEWYVFPGLGELGDNLFGPLLGKSSFVVPSGAALRNLIRRVQGTELVDRLVGSRKNDRLVGLAGADRLEGRGGQDTVLGGKGADTLLGGRGSDFLLGGAGRDAHFGGAGNDHIYSRDGKRDVVNCGKGRDRVVADRFDIVSRNCELVERSA